MNENLERVLADGIVEEIVGRLKSGKEAEVWIVRHRGEDVAAKIYKDRAQRSFKNNADYLEGRKVRNSRARRAIEKGSRFGRQAAEEAWKEAEANALFRLHDAGVRVPTPILYYEGVLLMELVKGPEGGPAPRLVEARLSAEEAGELYADLRSQIVKMLCADVIHGDLSPYNILLGERGPVIIDLPQTVDPAANPRTSSCSATSTTSAPSWPASTGASIRVGTTRGRSGRPGRGGNSRRISCRRSRLPVRRRSRARASAGEDGAGRSWSR